MKKIMVLALGKADAGCGKYALEIIKRLAINNKIIVFKSVYSKFNWLNLNSGNVTYSNIITYRSKFEFILATIFIYPFLLGNIFGKLLFGKVDVLYIPYFNPWEYFIIKLFKLFNKKVVYTVHDGVMHYGERDVIQERLHFASMDNATDVIFLTNYIKNLVLSHSQTNANIHVIPHGIFSLDGILRHKPVPSKKKLSILFLGKISKYKGIELLCQSLDLLDYSVIKKVVIAGKSNYEISWLSHLCLEVLDKWLLEEEIVALLNNSDILVLPYVEASQSGVVTFAIDAQIPIVCTDVGGLKEQIGSDAAVFVEPNAQSIADGLNLLASDKKLFNDLQNNLALKSSQLSWSGIAFEIEQILVEE
ncbi:MAG: glycosyltransferase [Burkholderiales bacterium]|nr:glycosyltransferase [Burkholderiales bacterium]